MYTITRQEVADKLGISIRSVDRYIKAGKLRSEKNWKIIYVNEDDIKSLSSEWKQEHEVIIPKKEIEVEEKTMVKSEQISTIWTLDLIYKDLRDEIKKKDEIIQVLSVQIWRVEEIAKNSVSLSEFKKSQYLLEESKFYLSNEVEDLKKENQNLEKKLKYEKTSNYILVIVLIIFLAVVSTIWFMGV